MSSERLPGKVMLDLKGKPIIWHIYQRLKRCSQLNLVVISTGEYKNNSEICDFAKQEQIPLYSGSEYDLIDRFYQTGKKFNASVIVRITADCPLVDPEVVDQMILEFKKEKGASDIVTNVEPSTFPHGLEAEIYSMDIIEKLWKDIEDKNLREWFPIYIKKNIQKFRILKIKNSTNLSNYRWTLDYQEDYELIKEIYKKLYKENKIFMMSDILELFKKYPYLVEINKKFVGHKNLDAPI